MSSTIPTVAKTSRAEKSAAPWYATGFAVVALIAGLRLLLHLVTANRYGVFRDEMYYLDCAQHLDWGYVDQPPMIAVIAWLTRHLFGTSMLAIRLLPAAAGAATVALAGYIAHQFGGRRYAMGLSALATALSGVFVINGHLLTMNVFEPLIWMGCAAIVIRIIQTGDQKLWLWFGLLAGIGLETKYSVAVYGLGIMVGVVLTPERKALAHKWIWLAGLLAFLIFLPNLLWNIHHQWPFVQLMHNIKMDGRDVVRSPLAFMLEQALMVNPFALPLWIAGLAWLFFGRGGRRYRLLGWAYVIEVGAWMALGGKDYYAAPAYPILFAAGGIAVEQWIERTRRAWLKPTFVVAFLALSLPFLPIIAPVLPVEEYVRYQKAIHFSPPLSEHGHAASPLPQYYSDELGWESLVAEIARAYHSLPPEVQAKTAIRVDNFGEAGAVDLFGPKYGLPQAISGHQNYWLWGPRDYTGESMLLIGEGRPEHLPQYFAHVEKVGHFEYPLALEETDIYWGQGLKWNLKDIWPEIKRWR
jgi:hypothetical protein